MGKKIIPLFVSDNPEDVEYQRFKDSIEDMDIEKAIGSCKISKDAKGHGTPLSFRMPDISLRIIGELKSKVERFECDSDVLRTIHIVGLKVLLDYLKKGGVIGDHLDDSILTIDKLNEHIKSAEMYESLKVTFEKIREMSRIYKDRRHVFNKKIELMEKDFNTIRDKDWREHLLKEFHKEVKRIKEEAWPEDE